MKILYHTDFDGQCSAYLIRNYMLWYTDTTADMIECIPMNYDKEIPWDKFDGGEDIYIVDFSFPNPADMQRLMELPGNKVVWIDHHITSINKYKDFPIYIPGIRKDGEAGCELVWAYLYPNKSMPWFVRYIGDRDVWRWEYGKDTQYFSNALFLHSDTRPERSVWNTLWNSEVVDKMLLQGKTIEDFRVSDYKRYTTSYCFPVKFCDYNAAVVNRGMAGSDLFANIPNKDKYDLFIIFTYDGKNTNFTLYANADRVHVGNLALNFGGGGHAGAAGFSLLGLQVPWQV